MRLLVTGSTGFVGSHATRALAGAGHELRLLVRSEEKLARVHGASSHDFVVGDMGDEASVDRAFEGCDGLVHCAAVVAMASARAEEVRRTNLRSVELLVGGAASRGLRSIVYVSSIGAMFAPDGPVITADTPVVDGRGAYARSKSDAERYVRELQERGAPVQTVYPASVIGPDDPGLSEANEALRTFVRDVALITSTGFQSVDVRDLADVISRIAPREKPGRFVAASRFQPWHELADTLEAVTGRSAPRVRAPGWMVRAGGHLFDALRTLREIEFPMTVEGMQFATQFPRCDASETETRLGLAFRDPAEIYRDAIRWMATAGHLPAKSAGRLAP